MNLIEKDENKIIFECSIDGLNIEEFLKMKNFSGRLFRKLYKSKKIYINGDIVNKRDKLKDRDIVTIVFQEEINDIEPELMDLDIVYEDFDILVINKNPNIVVHPTKSHENGTLSNGISYYYKINNINKKVRFVNRLDMDTSGLLIVAKHPFAHQQIAIQFKENKVIKKYYAIVEGVVVKDEDFIRGPIGNEYEGSIRKAVKKDGQRALTKYKVIERYNDSTLLEVQLFTGRSHQIRVHLSYMGHPIIGDSLYNKTSDHIKRQALHSYFLGIKSIREGKKLNLNSNLPLDMVNLIEKLKFK